MFLDHLVYLPKCQHNYYDRSNDFVGSRVSDTPVEYIQILFKKEKSKIRFSPCWGFGETADTTKLSKESETHNLETTATGKWPRDQNPIFSPWELKSVKKETQAAGDKTQLVKYLQGPEFHFQHMCRMLGLGTLITLVIPALERWQQTDLWLAGQTAYTTVNSVPVRDLR